MDLLKKITLHPLFSLALVLIIIAMGQFFYHGDDQAQVLGLNKTRPMALVDAELIKNATEENKPVIVKITSLQEIPEADSSPALYFFDIDDTLIDFPYMLGSKAWRKYITNAIQNDSQPWHDILTLAMAQSYPPNTIEPITSDFIKKLQNEGHGVFGLTARERQKWYDTPVAGVDQLTVTQLESVGINFAETKIAPQFTHLVEAPEYFEGIFFADLEPKGAYLLKLLSDLPKPAAKVVFIDDKLSQVESVAQALSQLGLPCACYWYVATDPKASRFDPLIANIQFYFWLSDQVILSDEEAEAIAKQDPQKDALYYLHASLAIATQNVH